MIRSRGLFAIFLIEPAKWII